MSSRNKARKTRSNAAGKSDVNPSSQGKPKTDTMSDTDDMDDFSLTTDQLPDLEDLSDNPDSEVVLASNDALLRDVLPRQSPSKSRRTAAHGRASGRSTLASPKKATKTKTIQRRVKVAKKPKSRLSKRLEALPPLVKEPFSALFERGSSTCQHELYLTNSVSTRFSSVVRPADIVKHGTIGRRDLYVFPHEKPGAANNADPSLDLYSNLRSRTLEDLYQQKEHFINLLAMHEYNYNVISRYLSKHQQASSEQQYSSPGDEDDVIKQIPSLTEVCNQRRIVDDSGSLDDDDQDAESQEQYDNLTSDHDEDSSTHSTTTTSLTDVMVTPMPQQIYPTVSYPTQQPYASLFTPPSFLVWPKDQQAEHLRRYYAILSHLSEQQFVNLIHTLQNGQASGEQGAAAVPLPLRLGGSTGLSFGDDGMEETSIVDTLPSQPIVYTRLLSFLYDISMDGTSKTPHEDLTSMVRAHSQVYPLPHSGYSPRGDLILSNLQAAHIKSQILLCQELYKGHIAATIIMLALCKAYPWLCLQIQCIYTFLLVRLYPPSRGVAMLSGAQDTTPGGAEDPTTTWNDHGKAHGSNSGSNQTAATEIPPFDHLVSLFTPNISINALVSSIASQTISIASPASPQSGTTAAGDGMSSPTAAAPAPHHPRALPMTTMLSPRQVLPEGHQFLDHDGLLRILPCRIELDLLPGSVTLQQAFKSLSIDDSIIDTDTLQVRNVPDLQSCASILPASFLDDIPPCPAGIPQFYYVLAALQAALHHTTVSGLQQHTAANFPRDLLQLPFETQMALLQAEMDKHAPSAQGSPEQQQFVLAYDEYSNSIRLAQRQQSSFLSVSSFLGEALSSSLSSSSSSSSRCALTIPIDIPSPTQVHVWTSMVSGLSQTLTRYNDDVRQRNAMLFGCNLRSNGDILGTALHSIQPLITRHSRHTILLSNQLLQQYIQHNHQQYHHIIQLHDALRRYKILHPAITRNVTLSGIQTLFTINTTDLNKSTTLSTPLFTLIRTFLQQLLSRYLPSSWLIQILWKFRHRFKLEQRLRLICHLYGCEDILTVLAEMDTSRGSDKQKINEDDNDKESHDDEQLHHDILQHAIPYITLPSRIDAISKASSSSGPLPGLPLDFTAFFAPGQDEESYAPHAERNGVSLIEELSRGDQNVMGDSDDDNDSNDDDDDDDDENNLPDFDDDIGDLPEMQFNYNDDLNRALAMKTSNNPPPSSIDIRHRNKRGRPRKQDESSSQYPYPMPTLNSRSSRNPSAASSSSSSSRRTYPYAYNISSGECQNPYQLVNSILYPIHGVYVYPPASSLMSIFPSTFFNRLMEHIVDELLCDDIYVNLFSCFPLVPPSSSSSIQSENNSAAASSQRQSFVPIAIGSQHSMFKYASVLQWWCIEHSSQTALHSFTAALHDTVVSVSTAHNSHLQQRYSNILETEKRRILEHDSLIDKSSLTQKLSIVPPPTGIFPADIYQAMNNCNDVHSLFQFYRKSVTTMDAQMWDLSSHSYTNVLSKTHLVNLLTSSLPTLLSVSTPMLCLSGLNCITDNTLLDGGNHFLFAFFDFLSRVGHTIPSTLAIAQEHDTVLTTLHGASFSPQASPRVFVLAQQGEISANRLHRGLTVLPEVLYTPPQECTDVTSSPTGTAHKALSPDVSAQIMAQGLQVPFPQFSLPHRSVNGTPTTIHMHAMDIRLTQLITAMVAHYQSAKVIPSKLTSALFSFFSIMTNPSQKQYYNNALTVDEVSTIHTMIQWAQSRNRFFLPNPVVANSTPGAPAPKEVYRLISNDKACAKTCYIASLSSLLSRLKVWWHGLHTELITSFVKPSTDSEHSQSNGGFYKIFPSILSSIASLSAGQLEELFQVSELTPVFETTRALERLSIDVRGHDSNDDDDNSLSLQSTDTIQTLPGMAPLLDDGLISHPQQRPLGRSPLSITTSMLFVAAQCLQAVDLHLASLDTLQQLFYAAGLLTIDLPSSSAKNRVDSSQSIQDATKNITPFNLPLRYPATIVSGAVRCAEMNRNIDDNIVTNYETNSLSLLYQLTPTLSSDLTLSLYNPLTQTTLSSNQQLSVSKTKIHGDDSVDDANTQDDKPHGGVSRQQRLKSSSDQPSVPSVDNSQPVAVEDVLLQSNHIAPMATNYYKLLSSIPQLLPSQIINIFLLLLQYSIEARPGVLHPSSSHQHSKRIQAACLLGLQLANEVYNVLPTATVQQDSISPQSQSTTTKDKRRRNRQGQDQSPTTSLSSSTLHTAMAVLEAQLHHLLFTVLSFFYDYCFASHRLMPFGSTIHHNGVLMKHIVFQAYFNKWCVDSSTNVTPKLTAEELLQLLTSIHGVGTPLPSSAVYTESILSSFTSHGAFIGSSPLSNNLQGDKPDAFKQQRTKTAMSHVMTSLASTADVFYISDERASETSRGGRLGLNTATQSQETDVIEIIREMVTPLLDVYDDVTVPGNDQEEDTTSHHNQSRGNSHQKRSRGRHTTKKDTSKHNNNNNNNNNSQEVVSAPPTTPIDVVTIHQQLLSRFSRRLAPQLATQPILEYTNYHDLQSIEQLMMKLSHMPDDISSSSPDLVLLQRLLVASRPFTDVVHLYIAFTKAIIGDVGRGFLSRNTSAGALDPEDSDSDSDLFSQDPDDPTANDNGDDDDDGDGDDDDQRVAVYRTTSGSRGSRPSEPGSSIGTLSTSTTMGGTSAITEVEQLLDSLIVSSDDDDDENEASKTVEAAGSREPAKSKDKTPTDNTKHNYDDYSSDPSTYTSRRRSKRNKPADHQGSSRHMPSSSSRRHATRVHVKVDTALDVALRNQHSRTRFQAALHTLRMMKCLTMMRRGEQIFVCRRV